jgi:spore maturation protein CgeB
MKILIVAPFGNAQRDPAIVEGFRQLGCEVAECSYGDLLFSGRFLSRLQFRLATGPILQNLTERVIDSVRAFRPDVVLFRRPLEFSTNMIRKIRAAHSAVYASFNNDDPFSDAYRDVRWRNLRQTIPEFDVHFAFRARNIDQYRLAGARKVALWEPFFTPWIHFPPTMQTEAVDDFHLLFAMHAEPDERREALQALLAEGIHVKVHSWNWAAVFGEADAKAIGVKPPIWEGEYVEAINKAAATLCFFSKQNNDELTSRVFEIPASRGLLLSWRTPRLEALYKDREEAFFFSNTGELMSIVQQLALDPKRVEEVKQRGYERLLASRCSVVDRCADAVEVFKGLV